MAHWKVNHQFHTTGIHLLEGDVVEFSEAEALALTNQAGSLLTRVAADAPLVNAQDLDKAAGRPVRERRQMDKMQDQGSAGPMSGESFGGKRDT